MLTVEVPDPSAPAVADGANWFVPLLVVVTGMFMAILDVTIVNVAVPAIQHEFGGSLDDVLWIATAYTLTLGVIVPLSSWLGDRIGLTKLLVISLAGFALGSGLCGLAGSLDALIAFRILQAIPGGILPVAALTMVYRLTPPEKIGVGMGMYGISGVAAPAVGPVLGGYLVEYVDWRLVFYINVPIGLLTALGAMLLVPKVPTARVHRFDFAGFAAIALAMFAILLAASEGEHWGWSGYRIRLLFVFGALFLALFVVIELQVEHPLLDVRLFANRQFACTVVLTTVGFANLLVGVFYIPVFLQQAQGLPAFNAGMLTLPAALAMCVTIPISGLLYERMGPRMMGTFGFLYLVGGDVLMANINPDMTHTDVILWSTLRGIGIGVSMVPILTWGVLAVGPSRTNHASAINNVSQQVGGALGLAALGTLITAQQAQLFSDRAALLQPDSALATMAGPMLHQPTELSASTFAIAYRLGTMLQVRTMSVAFSDMFLVVALVTAASIPLILLLRRSALPPVPGVTDAADAEHDAIAPDGVAASATHVAVAARTADRPEARPTEGSADLPGPVQGGRHRASTLR